MLCQTACERCRREFFKTVFDKYKANGNALFQKKAYKKEFLSQRDKWFLRDWQEGFVFCHKLESQEASKQKIPIENGIMPKDCPYKLEHLVS